MEVKVNLNTASFEELLTLTGIGPVLAKRILEFREKIGRFQSVDQLLEVEGISPALLERLRNFVTTEDVTDDEQEKSVTVQIIVKSSEDEVHGDYTGHRVVANYTRVQNVGEDGSQVILVGAQESANLSPDGTTNMTFPSREKMRRDIIMRVHAPDGTILASRTLEARSLPDEVVITTRPQKPPMTQPVTDSDFGQPSRIRGRVIDADGKKQISGKQVVLWGAQKPSPSEKDFRALIVLQTDNMGNFSGTYPTGVFTDAYATVAIGDDPTTVPIHLTEEGSFPESVILVVDLDTSFQDDDCGCGQSSSNIPHNPDNADLTRGDGTFTVDAGAGGCVDFTKPDRTLEEYSYSYVVRTTEPEIKGLTLDEPAKVSLAQIAKYFDQPIGMSSRSLAIDDTEAAVRLRATATQPIPAEVEKIDAKVLRTLVRDPDGFSLTNLVHAAQKTLHHDLVRVLNAVVNKVPGRNRLTCESPVDWDDEPTIYQACTIAHGHVLRFKQEWVADGYSMGNLLYSLPLAPGQKKQIAVVDWERRETSVRTEALDEREALSASLQRDRDINEIVSGTVSESIRGGSHASSGSFGGGLGIGAILGPVGGLLGIGGGTASADSSAWQSSSRRTAASALNQLRDRTIQSASAVRSQRSTVVQTVRQGERVTATTESVANYNHCHAITIQYFEVLRHLLVRQRLADVQECLFVPLFMSRFTRDKALRWRNTLRSAVFNPSLRRGFDALERIENNYVGSDFPTGMYGDQLIENIEGDIRLRFELKRPKDSSDDFDASTWVWLSHIFPSLSADEFYKTYLKDQSLKDKIFLEQLGQQIAERFVQHLQVLAIDQSGVKHNLKLDTTLVSDFVNDRSLYVTLRMGDNLPVLKRSDIKSIEFSSISRLIGLPLFNILPTGSKVIVESGTLRYRTKYSSNMLFRDARILNDLTNTDGARVSTPLNRQELRNPREEDKELARNLLDHLNENIERYHHAIWWRMSSDRRYMLLDGFEAPHSGGRSVASVVENDLIGIVGNCLILPVARGIHLDPTYRQDVENPVDLFEHYQPAVPVDPMRIAVPTRGVYAESVMGACNSCEFKEEERFWRWEESPIPDSPTGILPLSTDSRRSDAPDLTAKDFPTPIINLQNAPSAPDPTGIAAALQLLGTPNIFKDITGLEGTQQNAREALQGALNTAQFFGGKAADLALQANMKRDIDKSMRTIQQAHEKGLIDDQQASELTEGAIRGLIGAGSNKTPQPMTTRDVEELTQTAGQNAADVKVSRPTGERVEVNARREGGLEDTPSPRTVIILPPTANSADNRSFNPSHNSKSGVIDMEATVRNAPVGATFRWSRPSPDAINIDNPNNTRTRIRAMRPGASELDFSVHDSSGTPLASTKLQISVPQFVHITEDAAAFDPILAAIHLDMHKDQVILKAKEVVDHLLRTTNVRTVWAVGALSESLPAHLPATHITTLTLRGDPPAGQPNLLGQTNFVGGAVGAATLNETIDIFPGAYDNPVTPGGKVDVDVETQALILQLESQTFSDPALEQFAIEVYGRLLGETMAHEIIHSLLGFSIPSGHNSPPIANDLMNAGSERTFRQRTGFEDTTHTSPVIPSNFIDHGITSIGGLQATNQALIDAHFPVPPAFS